MARREKKEVKESQKVVVGILGTKVELTYILLLLFLLLPILSVRLTVQQVVY